MRVTAVVALILSVCTALRKSQAKTLAALAAALGAPRASGAARLCASTASSAPGASAPTPASPSPTACRASSPAWPAATGTPLWWSPWAGSRSVTSTPSWCSSNRAQECSAFTIGRALLGWRRVRPAAALAAVLAAVLAVGAKWG